MITKGKRQTKAKVKQQINTKVVIQAILTMAARGIVSAIRTTPLGVMLIAGIAFYQLEALPASVASAIPTTSYMILVFGMAITSCFNRSRFFFILLILLLSQLGMSAFVPGHIDKSVALQVFYSVISILLPLNILFFSLIAERGILSGSGQRNFILILLQANFIMILILSGDRELFNAISGDFINLTFIPRTPIPNIAVIAFMMAGLLLMGIRRRATLHFKITNFSVLIVIFLAHHFNNLAIAMPFFYAIAGLNIVVSVIQDYYSKAYSDELTGLPARRSLNEEMMKLEGNYVIAMVDIDFFKKFNDNYGHDAGDDVLRLIARNMKECKKGMFFRYGGEEFTILFPGKRLVEVVPYLDEVREKIAQCKFVLRGKEGSGKGAGKKLNVTVSIGVAEPSNTSADPQEVMKAADTALYRAKEQGRNRVST